MTDIRCFCKTCVDTKDVTDVYIGVNGIYVYEMECGHSRLIQVEVKKDEM